MPHSNKEALVRLLRDLARQVQSLDSTDIDDVLTGAAKLQVRVENGKHSLKPISAKPQDAELHGLAAVLRSLTSREEGEKLLGETISVKEDLVRLARILDVPVQKSDTAEQLRSKVIESTIGFRLRSAAVQGKVAETPSSDTIPDKRAV